MQIARWYCPTGHTTFSLLLDCLASRLPGSLDEVGQVVVIVEAKVAAGESIEKAAERIRPDIQLPGAVRWVRQRLGAVRMALLALATLLPGQLGNEPRLGDVRKVLGTEHALMRLREIGSAHLGSLAPPFGFWPRPKRRRRKRRRSQQGTGPDPRRTSR
jgi:hypothetical protein